MSCNHPLLRDEVALHVREYQLVIHQANLSFLLGTSDTRNERADLQPISIKGRLATLKVAFVTHMCLVHFLWLLGLTAPQRPELIYMSTSMTSTAIFARYALLWQTASLLPGERGCGRPQPSHKAILPDQPSRILVVAGSSRRISTHARTTTSLHFDLQPAAARSIAQPIGRPPQRFLPFDAAASEQLASA